MNREEVIDLAMDIFENTDATMEEAMGVAIESAENKMSDAEKYRRRVLKVEGAARASARPGKYSGLADDAISGKAPIRNQIANYHGHEYDRAKRLKGYNMPSQRRDGKGYMPDSYSGMTQKQKNKIDKSVDRMLNKENLRTIKSRTDYIKGNPTYSDFDTNRTIYHSGYKLKRRGNHPIDDRFSVDYRNVKANRASKEAAIMDTALDFLDMYDVSLEEAIDMAYDYIVD